MQYPVFEQGDKVFIALITGYSNLSSADEIQAHIHKHLGYTSFISRSPPSIPWLAVLEHWVVAWKQGSYRLHM